MTEPTLLNSGRALSTPDIERVEHALHVRLPEPYATFLLRTNGGRAEPAHFGGEWGGSLLDFFLQVDGGEYDDLVDVNARLAPPPGLLAVATDEGGNYVCIAVDELRHGQVFFWALDDGGRASRIADSFGNFLASFGVRVLPTTPSRPTAPRDPTPEECRQDIERGLAVLRTHQERRVAEDHVIDALLVAATRAATAIAARGGLSTYAELHHALLRIGEKHEWLRGRRNTGPATATFAGLAEYRALGEEVARATVDHHVSEIGAADRVRELLQLLGRTHHVLLALGEAEESATMTSLDDAHHRAHEWLDEDKGHGTGGREDDSADGSWLPLDPRSYEERQRDAARDQEAATPSTVTPSGLPLLTWDDGGWEAQDVFSSWAGFQSRGGPYGARDSKRAAGHVTVSIATPYDRYARPHGCQLAAYRWLKAHEPQVVAAVLDAGFRAYPDGRAEWLSHYPDEASDLPVITSPGGLTAVMGLHAVHVLATARDGVAYVGFEFGCNWDAEHGFGVLTHLDRVIEHGNARVAFERSAAVVADGGVDLDEPTCTVRKQ